MTIQSDEYFASFAHTFPKNWWVEDEDYSKLAVRTSVYRLITWNVSSPVADFYRGKGRRRYRCTRGTLTVEARVGGK